MYHGEYTLQETVILTQLNLNMQARDLKRMLIRCLASLEYDSKRMALVVCLFF